MEPTYKEPTNLMNTTGVLGNTTGVLGTPSQDVMVIDEKISQLPAEKQKMINDLAGAIDIADSQAVIQFGTPAQRNISNFSETLLGEVQTKDSGFVGESLNNLMLEIKGVEVDTLLKKGAFDGMFGGFKKKVTKFMTGYQKVSVTIDKIVTDLDTASNTLLRDIKMLDSLYNQNLDYLDVLDMYIFAGSLKIKELQNTILPEMKAKADSDSDPHDVQKYNDMLQLLNRFEKKVSDLKLSRMIAIQTAPQIRVIQNNNQVLVEKIQSSIMNTIPLWKNQIVIAISLLRQENAVKLQEDVTNTTNQLLTKNSELLKDNSIRVAKEVERGIVDMETLRKVHNNLITTIEEVMRIQEEGRANRNAAEIELQNLEKELKKKLLQTR